MSEIKRLPQLELEKFVLELKKKLQYRTSKY